MNKKSILLTVAVAALVLFACKPPKEFVDPINVSVNPLEMHAGKVEVTIDGTYPVKYFQKKMVMTVTPVLKSKISSAEWRADSKTYQGEKVKDNNDVIKYKVGGEYKQVATFDYNPEMESSELWLEITGKLGKKEFTIDPIKVADGVIVTPLLVAVEAGEVETKIEKDNFQRIIEEKQEAEIRFLIQQSEVRKSEISSDAVVALTKRIDEANKAANLEMTGLEISSYASPDGGLDLNEKLAEKRDQASQKYINKELKKLKATVTIDSKFTAEDWEGFQALMEQSNIQDKEVILRVLSMYSDPEQREAEIKNLSAAYKAIADEILPQLRRSKMTLAINVIGRSDAEIDSLAKANPDTLSLEELLYAATLTADLERKAEIYTKVTELYADEYRGFNNLGVVRYEQGDIDAAGRAFAKALELNAKNAAVNYNCGVVALVKGDDAKAEEYFGNAGGVGESLDHVNGVLAIRRADYKKAVELFGAAKVNNAALAKILTKDYAGARSVLEGVEKPNARTNYLLAVVAARQNDRAAVVANLKKAIEADGAWKEKAAKDAEFLAFAEDAEFAALVK
ncbi:MAG: TPR end-of-group domain-containing protein [Paludibacteraceae bacterium]